LFGAIRIGLLVAWFAERSAVGNVESQFWKLRKRLYVIGVNLDVMPGGAAVTALDAGIVVAGKNGPSPILVSCAGPKQFGRASFATLPKAACLPNLSKPGG
jgi:hypothetical protein